MCNSYIKNISVKVLRAVVPKKNKYPTASFVDDGFCVLILTTSCGVEGIGEPSPYSGELSEVVKLLRSEIKEHFVGKKLTDAWHLMEKCSYTKASDSFHAAIAGLSQAIIDALGKESDTPAWILLSKDNNIKNFGMEIAAYASAGMYYNEQPLELLIEEAAKFKDEGFSAWKFRPPIPEGMSHLERTKRPPQVNVENIFEVSQKIRLEVGDTFNLMLDLGCRLSSIKDAIWLCDALSELDFFMIEEPLPRDPRLYKDLRGCCPNSKISGGESLTSFSKFEEWVSMGCFDVIQPDTNLVGVYDSFKIGSELAGSDIKYIPHNWANGVSIAANIHTLAALQFKDSLIEFSQVYNPLRDELLVDGGYSPSGGMILIGDKPGLGIELNEAAIAFYDVEK